jgi:hypothetical protein
LPEGSLFIREIEDQPKVVMREIRFFNPWHHYGRDIHAKEVGGEGVPGVRIAVVFSRDSTIVSRSAAAALLI